MATCKTVISSAFRRSGIVGAGRSASDTLMKVGLERMQDMYTGMAGSGLLGRFNDVYLVPGSTYVAHEQDRIYIPDNTVTVTIPTTLTDPNSGVIRTPLDRAAIIQVNPATAPAGSPVLQIWDAFAGNWIGVLGLTLSSYAPFSYRYEDGLKNWLAVHLADEGGYSIRPSLALAASRFKLAIATRFDAPRRTQKAGSYY